MRVQSFSAAALELLLLSSAVNALLAAQIQPSYDFIIVGGGAAGLAVAARLSESANTTVLLLEAGSSPDVFPNYKTPIQAPYLLGTQLDWGFVTPAQPSLNGRSLTYHRGRALGGSTVINGMAYGRGSKSVFDLWESLGNPGWGWDSVFPYFVKSTAFNPSKTGAPYETFNSSAYSPNGPLQLTYADFVTPGSLDFIEAIDDLGIAPIVEDLNLGNNIGTKQQPLTMDKYQQRSSSFDSYYMLAQNRTNLDVVPYGLVQEIGTSQNGSDVRAINVYVTSQSTGQITVVTANKEIIVAGGAFQTPQLLMLSGIGPADELTKFGIPVKYDSPNVGKNMQDHNYFSVTVRANSSTSIDSLTNFAVLEAAAEAYIANQTGPLTTPGGTTYGFQRVPVADLQAMGAVELENRTQQAHIEYLFEPTYYPSQPSQKTNQYPAWKNETYISITAGIIAPASRGSVTLQSRLITDQPVINVNYFNATTDQKMGIYAFKNLRKILAHPSMAAWGIGPDNGEVVPGVAVQTDEEILEHIQNTAIPIWHASGTCAMLPQEQGGVVDSNLKVYGVKGLRIVDASVMPVVPDQHTMGAVYMLAEKAADLIKQEYGLTS